MADSERPDKKTDRESVYLEELMELPRELSGTLGIVQFCDQDGLPFPYDIVLINPMFVDRHKEMREGSIQILIGDPSFLQGKHGLY